MTSNVPTLTLTPAEIARWQEDCAQIDQDIEKLTKRKDEILQKLDAARLLAPALFEAAVGRHGVTHRTVLKRKGLTTWPQIIEEYVRNSGSGIRQKEMLEQIRSGVYGSRLADSESGYYNAVQKVLKRRIVVKRGEWLFTPSQYDEYMAKLERGEVSDVADETDYGSPAAAAAMRFIAAHPGGKSIDVIRAVWAEHDGPNLPSKTSLYNTLARLVEQKRIRKDEGGAFYLFNENEAPSDQPRGASDAGEVAASPNENRAGLRLIG